MKYSLLPLIFLFSAYAFGQEESAKPPVIGIKIPLHGEVAIKGITIKFLDVIEDSRCPKGTNCIWEGRAIVKAEVSSEGKTETKELIFGAVRPGEKKNTNLFSSSQLVINGLTLHPYPSVENNKEDVEYSLVVSEEQIK